MNLSKEYKFINFDTNKGNKLAYTLSLAVAEQPGKNYSPLFISGNEKERTHLMSAIANYVIELFNYRSHEYASQSEAVPPLSLFEEK